MSDSPTRLEATLNLLESSGFIDPRDSDYSAPQKLVRGLARCLDALSPDELLIVSIETRPIDENLKLIEEAMNSIEEFPFNLEACQLRNLEGESLLPVVQWLLDRGRESQSYREEQRKVVVKSQLQRLRERVSSEGVDSKVKMLVSIMQSLKDLERQESELQSYSNARHSKLEDEVIELKEKIASGCDGKRGFDELSSSLSESEKELDSARKELASTLQAMVGVKRQLDDKPSQSELVQYERRFSELYGHIQGKHLQTQKYYDTYNALLEIKELMLKETSLLNSISSQFQDAITSPVGRSKLIESMEGIVKSSQQKLQKVQFGLEEQQRTCDALRERCSEAIAQQRHWHLLLKAFQDERGKNERLRSSSSV